MGRPAAFETQQYAYVRTVRRYGIERHRQTFCREVCHNRSSDTNQAVPNLLGRIERSFRDKSLHDLCTLDTTHALEMIPKTCLIHFFVSFDDGQIAFFGLIVKHRAGPLSGESLQGTFKSGRGRKASLIAD